MTELPIVFGRPWFDEAEEELVLRTLRSGWIGQGPLVETFERRLAAYLGAPSVVAVSSCTAALHLALVAAGVGPGDEVITTPFTFVATVNAIEHAGATAVLVDIDPETLNLTPEAAAAAVTERTRAVMPVHFGGRPLDVAGWQELADRHDLWLIEDGAHAIGAVVDGRRVGGSGHRRTLTCFSFYPNKNLASAEGGAVALADPEVAQNLRRLRLHGLEGDAWDRYRSGTYLPSVATAAGFKANLSDVQAAIALAQLDKLEGFLATRESLAAGYDELLDAVPAVRPVDRGGFGLGWRHALHLYQVAVEGLNGRRDVLVALLKERGIGAAVHYIGVNQHPWYRERFHEPFPASDWASACLLTLPLHVHMHAHDLERVVAELVDALEHTGPARVMAPPTRVGAGGAGGR
jgi:dTDP-4-amino-4,6-dideoxygalactose transaminase